MKLHLRAAALAALIAPLPVSAQDASPATREANAAVAQRLPLADQSDFEDARRGRIAQIEAPILDADGKTVWDPARFAFLSGPPPATVNPSLWRQSQLVAEHGLFEVTDGVWQVRGYDLANMTLVAGKTGWIVIDPLLTVQTAAAALKLANDTLGARPVSAVIFTHSHADHFGGVGGLDLAPGTPVIAPKGFTEEAVSENLLAGPIMQRRAQLMFGDALAAGPEGQVGVGLGPALAAGTSSLAAVTDELPPEDVTRTVDGVTFEFMDAGETEAPAETVFYLPEKHALIMSEVASGTLHNALTLRGAQVRDLLHWSKVIDRALTRFGGKADVVLASHHWPTWGQENVRTYLENQRDIYRYIHDQTIRRANKGETMHEIAASLPEPAFAAKDFSVRGYYGTLNHDAKAVYQRYFGWWDGVPANFDPLPPEEEAAHYIEALGGRERVLELGKAAHAAGDDRWAATLLNKLAFDGEASAEEKVALADAYRQLGYQAESGAWRDYYLAAAQELTDGPPAPRGALGNPAFLAAVPTASLFDALAVRYAPEKAARTGYTIQFVFPDRDERLALEVRDSVLVPHMGVSAENPAATVTVDRADYDRIVAGTPAPQLVQEGALKVQGDMPALLALFGALEAPSGGISVVTR